MRLAVRPGLDGSGEVHGEGHRAQHAGRVVHEPDEVAQRGLADQVDDAVEPRVPVARLAALHELDTATEMIDDLLITGGVPPLGGEVVLAAADDDPEAVPNAALGKARWELLLILG